MYDYLQLVSPPRWVPQGAFCERCECLLPFKEMFAPRFPVPAWAPSESQGEEEKRHREPVEV